MKIAMTGNVFPFGRGHAYGGERIIGYLTEELIKLGHDVWLFAREGTVPPAGVQDFIPVGPLQDSKDVHYEAVVNYWKEEWGDDSFFDIYQCNYFGNGYNADIQYLARQVCELTWCIWCHCQPFFPIQNAQNIISYSKVMQEDFKVRGVHTTMIHYGIPKDLYCYEDTPEDYAVWIGKIEGGKAPDLAIKLAKAAGMKIVLIGPPYNTGCFWNHVQPYIDNVNVFWVRGADDEQKQKIMSKAKVFISSNDNTWKEHAGIVNMESLAMGVPIIGFSKIGQECAIEVDEFIEDGRHGFFLRYHDSNNVEEILDKGVPLLNKIYTIDRMECRKQFEKMFSAGLMASRYEYFYNYILENGPISSLEIPF